MGLISGLFTWPVAPVRGVAWIADQVLDVAVRLWADPAAVERGLAEVDEKRRSGELSEDEAAELEEELIARLMHDRGGQHG